MWLDSAVIWLSQASLWKNTDELMNQKCTTTRARQGPWHWHPILCTSVLHLSNTEWFSYSFSVKRSSLKPEDIWHFVKAGFIPRPVPAHPGHSTPCCFLYLSGLRLDSKPTPAQLSLPNPCQRSPRTFLSLLSTIKLAKEKKPSELNYLGFFKN